MNISAKEKLHVVNDAYSILKNKLQSINFFDEYWEKQRLHINHLYDDSELKSIFNLKEFDELLTSGHLMTPYLDIIENKQKKKPQLRISPSPSTDVKNTLEKYNSGATIRVPHMELFLPNLLKYCQNLEKYIGVPIRANMYMTPPFSQGFQPHYDLDDIIVLQVTGHKIWSLYENYTNQQPLPNRDMDFNAVMHRPEGIPKEVTLEKGGVLYLPRGFMHEARTEDQHSIHITLALVGQNVGETLQQILRAHTFKNNDLRKVIRIPDNINKEYINSYFDKFHSLLQNMQDESIIENSIMYLKQYFDEHRNPELKGKLQEIIDTEN